MATAVAPLLLSSREEVESIWSRAGVSLRIDDGDDGVTDGTGETDNDVQLLIDALIEASDNAYQKLLVAYDDIVLETSTWVRRRVSYIVCHLISLRKGNPAQYCDMFERYMKDFQDIADGAFIPFLKPRGNFQPTMSNMSVNNWHANQNLRVNVANSEGPRDSKQFENEAVHFGFRGFWF